MNQPIRIADLKVRLSNFPVLGSEASGLNLELEPGLVHCILGPSGCGKTTLLRVLAGLESVTSGKVQGIAHDTLSFVFQDSRLLPWLSTQENVELPLHLKNVPVVNSGASELLESLGLKNSSSLFPHQLSGGMKMRTSLARALITNPNTILFDEPFSALDEQTRHQLQKMVLDLHKKLKGTFVFVTHSISEAVFMADRILIMAPTGGKIIFDEKIKFPERNDALRTSPEFNAWIKKIGEAK